MKKLLNLFLVLFIAFSSACAVKTTYEDPADLSQRAAEIRKNPLPSWNNTQVKRNIIDYVNKITDKKGEHYIPPEDRIAVFDNDGTLWAEKPVVQLVYMYEKVKEKMEKDASLKNTEPYKSIAAGTFDAGDEKNMVALFKLSMEMQAGMTTEEYFKDVAAFFEKVKYPGKNVSFHKMIYKPQKEVIEFLQLNGFKVYICSGGDTDFMRVVSYSYYGIIPENVIGSLVEYKYDPPKNDIVRGGKLTVMNNETEKPVNIFIRIGKRPVFASGNVGNAGDIDMLLYSQGSQYPSFQLLVNHDDAEREFEYSEPDGKSLSAAQKNKWNVVSIKEDWNAVF